MNYFRSLRTGTGLMALAALMFLIAFNVGGCSEIDDPTTPGDEMQAPQLPAPELLAFDFSFFDQAGRVEKSSGEYDNFYNAYLRCVILDVTAHLVLAAPVAAFSHAVHTVPTAQPDGSWRWTYNWQFAGDRVGIVLVGLPAGDVVEWELSLVPDGTTVEYLWFSGATGDNGQEGRWIFRDLDTEGFPICGEIAWGHHGNGRFLEFVSREPDSNGDRLAFYDNDPDFQIEFTLGTGEESSFIQWHAAGNGSLRVPDYNEGVEACWDIYQRNIDCQ